MLLNTVGVGLVSLVVRGPTTAAIIERLLRVVDPFKSKSTVWERASLFVFEKELWQRDQLIKIFDLLDLNQSLCRLRGYLKRARRFKMNMCLKFSPGIGFH
jgi:hypothetical protein